MLAALFLVFFQIFPKEELVWATYLTPNIPFQHLANADDSPILPIQVTDPIVNHVLTIIEKFAQEFKKFKSFYQPTVATKNQFFYVCACKHGDNSARDKWYSETNPNCPIS